MTRSKSKPRAFLSSNQPDASILANLALFERIGLGLMFSIAGTVLAAWLIPPLGRLLPNGWTVMKANTTVLILASSLSILFSRPCSSPRRVFAGRLLGMMVFLIAALILAGYLGFHLFAIDTILASDAKSTIPGRISVEAGVVFMVMGIILMNIRARKRPMAHVTDFTTLVLGMLLLTYVGSLLFGAVQLFGLPPQHHLAPTTFLCVLILTCLIFSRRTEYGSSSILVGGGIGGKTARAAAPVVILLPFLIDMMRGVILRYSMLEPKYVIAASPSITAILAYCLILALARRTGDLENAIRELSLRDELTQLYNRRGFYALAEQAHSVASRSGQEFSVLFLDVDRLKYINDTYGHDAGSELLRDVAQLLQQTFRDIDVVGRIGGDEFVVAAKADASSMAAATERLLEAMAEKNTASGRRYEISFSMGLATSNASDESLEQLVERADVLMYEVKRDRKRQPHKAGVLATA